MMRCTCTGTSPLARINYGNLSGNATQLAHEFEAETLHCSALRICTPWSSMTSCSLSNRPTPARIRWDAQPAPDQERVHGHDANESASLQPFTVVFALSGVGPRCLCIHCMQSGAESWFCSVFLQVAHSSIIIHQVVSCLLRACLVALNDSDFFMETDSLREEWFQPQFFYDSLRLTLWKQIRCDKWIRRSCFFSLQLLSLF